MIPPNILNAVSQFPEKLREGFVALYEAKVQNPEKPMSRIEKETGHNLNNFYRGKQMLIKQGIDLGPIFETRYSTNLKAKVKHKPRMVTIEGASEVVAESLKVTVFVVRGSIDEVRAVLAGLN